MTQSNTRMSIKGVVKSGSGAAIRVLSYLVPKRFLFRSFLQVRKLSIRMQGAGVPTLVLKAIDHLFYSLRPALVETRLRDAKFFVRLNDPCHYNQLLGVHEPAVVEWLSAHLNDGMNVLDIGANVGFYTLLAAGLVGPQGTVLSVEADPDVAALLEQSIHFNALQNVRVVSGAAYRTPGRVKLGRALASSWYTGLYYGKAVEWLDVPAFTMDSLVLQFALDHVDFVKIDVEGAEGDVLEGMDRILREDRPRLLVELHGFRAAGNTHPAVRQLEKAKYSVRFLTEDHVVAEPLRISG